MCRLLQGTRAAFSEASKFSLIHFLIVSATVRDHRPESDTELHIENVTVNHNQVDFSTVASKEGVKAQTPRKSHASSDAPENSTLQTAAAHAEGRNNSSRRTDFAISSVGPEIATALTSHSSTVASKSMEELNKSTALQSPSVSWIKRVHVATTFPDGVPRTLQSLTVSPGPLNETESFPMDSEIATTSASVNSTPSEAELKGNSEVISNPGDGKFIEPSTKNGFGLTSSEVSVGFWQNDSPTSRGHQLASSSDAENRSRVSPTETVSGSVPLVTGGESTARSFLIDSKTFTDATGSSTFYPDVVNASVLTQFSASAPQSRGSDTALGDRSYSEPATESLSSPSSESPNSSAPRGERSTTEDSPELGVISEAQEGTSEGTSGARAHSPHTSATSTGNGERTLRSLTNGSTTPGEAGRSVAAPRETETATQQGNVTVTGDAHLVSGSLAASSAFGVTGDSYDPVSGTDVEERSSSDHTDHTYVSSTFAKGERALLSITDNSSSSDIRESSTSSITISNSSHSDYSSSSQAQTEQSNVSSYEGEYAQPSTESLVLRTANPPSYTPTINMPSTLVLLNTSTGSLGDSSSSSSGSPLPLPSVSQSHQLFSSTLPSTRAFTHPLESTPGAPTPLSSSPPPSPIPLTASTFASLSVSQTTLPPSSSTLVLPAARDPPVTSVWMSTIASVSMLPGSQTADPKNQSNRQHEQIITESKLETLESLPTEATKAVTVRSTLGIPMPPALTESSTEQTLPVTSTGIAQMSPALTTTTLETSSPPVTTPRPPSNTAAVTAGPTAVQTTARKQLLPTSPETVAPQISTEGPVTTKRSQVYIDATTQLVSLTSVPTSAKELTTVLGITEEYSPTSHFLRTSPSPETTDVSTTEVLTPKSTTFAAQSSTQPPTASSSPASGRTQSHKHTESCTGSGFV
ncbi:hypothetical protein HPG69_010478 [Diceros bicornis minor]|uniref:Uncharacterized protein n=1 Tax=Diceros bicornis minor TaxID=77932 RepID=A0A7J7F8N6_DICBM|nr:hypothetical protein HPG69_010478 [Diceros bicornis minor]